MASKLKLRAENKRLKKKLKQYKKIQKVGVKSIEEKDARIAQLVSIVEAQPIHRPKDTKSIVIRDSSTDTRASA